MAKKWKIRRSDYLVLDCSFDSEKEAQRYMSEKCVQGSTFIVYE